MDETDFTSKQISAKVWAPSGIQGLEVVKNSLGFNAVAVVVALDVKGRLFAFELKQSFINGETFIELLK